MQPHIIVEGVHTQMEGGEIVVVFFLPAEKYMLNNHPALAYRICTGIDIPGKSKRLTEHWPSLFIVTQNGDLNCKLLSLQLVTSRF